jgi:chlorobactene glucosyltransferase
VFAGFRYSVPAIIAVILFNLATSILPFLLLAGALLTNALTEPWFPLVAWQSGLIIGIRLLLALRFRLDAWSPLLHPLAMGMLIGIALNSIRWVLIGGGARWKGRHYDFRNHPVTQP